VLGCFLGFCLEKEMPGRKEGREEGREEGSILVRVSLRKPGRLTPL